jgi:hypothetical protein
MTLVNSLFPFAIGFVSIWAWAYRLRVRLLEKTRPSLSALAVLRVMTLIDRALVLLIAFVAVAAAATEEIQAPVRRNGDCWIFKIVSKPSSGFSPPNKPIDGTYILRIEKATLHILELVDGNDVPSDQSSVPGLVGFHRPQGPLNPLLKFPLFVGKQWQYSIKLRATHTINLEVVSEELVTTQAGVFPALKIERTRQYATASPRWGTGIVATRGSYFYSPDTKSIVKYDTRSDDGSILNIELLAFQSFTAPSNNKNCWHRGS